jgi:hypothetical protein
MPSMDADARSFGETLDALVEGGPNRSIGCFASLVRPGPGPHSPRGFRGLSLHAIDGSCMRVQDSDPRFEHLGKPGGRGGSGDAGYPQLRIATLMNLDSHMLVDVVFGRYATSQEDLATKLCRSVPHDSLMILVDRGFNRVLAGAKLVSTGPNRQLMVRLRKDTPPEIMEELADGPRLVDAIPSKKAKKARQGIGPGRGRVISCQHPGGEPGRLCVTLLDPEGVEQEVWVFFCSSGLTGEDQRPKLTALELDVLADILVRQSKQHPKAPGSLQTDAGCSHL